MSALLEAHPGPWTRSEAAHLLRRAGFEPAPDEVEECVRCGGATVAVERLLGATEESPRFRELDPLGEALAAASGGAEVGELAGWWLARAVHTRRPLVARLALFWHNHFATSNQKVNAPPLMLRQMRMFEKLGSGRFEELLLALARDPAMIVWLDGDSNHKGKPNENFARELFELFALGPGNYSERDIREAARAFSGWHQKAGAFHFDPRDHDNDPKTIFGASGNHDGTDVVRLTVQHAACSGFLARKVLREFLCDAPSDALVAELAAALRERDLNIGSALKTLLSSREFYEPRYRRVRIKSPTEFLTGLARTWSLRAPGRELQQAVSQMGQRIFEPPSVKGWDGGRRWISSTTMLVRISTAGRAARGEDGRGLDADAWIARAGLQSSTDAVEFACRTMLGDDAGSPLPAALQKTCTGSPAEALRSAVAAIAGSPDYQFA